MAKLMDDAVEGLARGKRCKARVLCRNVHKAGRAKFLQPGEFHTLSNIPAECQAALDRSAQEPCLAQPWAPENGSKNQSN